MSDLILHKKNEAYIQFECDRGIAQELSDYFTFFVPGHQFTPAFKSRIWDGKIRLADLRSFTIYHGLVPYIEIFCKERDYTLDQIIDHKKEYLIEKFDELINELNKPIIKKFQRFLSIQDDDEVINKIKEDIKLILYNNKNIPKTTHKLLIK